MQTSTVALCVRAGRPERANESKVKNADYQSDTDPRALMELIRRVLQRVKGDRESPA